MPILGPGQPQAGEASSAEPREKKLTRWMRLSPRISRASTPTSGADSSPQAGNRRSRRRLIFPGRRFISLDNGLSPPTTLRRRGRRRIFPGRRIPVAGGGTLSGEAERFPGTAIRRRGRQAVSRGDEAASPATERLPERRTGFSRRCSGAVGNGTLSADDGPPPRETSHSPGRRSGVAGDKTPSRERAAAHFMVSIQTSPSSVLRAR